MRAGGNCTVPKYSTYRCVQFVEAGEVGADMGQIAEAAAVGAAWSTVRGRSSNAELRKGWRIAAAELVIADSAADGNYAEKSSRAGLAESRLPATQQDIHL